MAAIHAVAAAFYPVDSTRVSITNTGDSAVGVAPVSAGYQINANGSVYPTSTLVAYETWLVRGAASDYQARATLVSGTSPADGNALSTWLSCSTSPTWALTKSSGAVGSFVTCTLTIEIRDASTGTILDSATVTLTAEIG